MINSLIFTKEAALKKVKSKYFTDKDVVIQAYLNNRPKKEII